jgi:hypothetical protein
MLSRPAKHALAAIWLICWPALVMAGGGPEGVLLVVNPESPASMTIANHWARLRAIPPDNVIYLPWPPNAQTTDIDTFRERILVPVLMVIQNRGLANQINCVVYSSDFPWGIGLDSDIRKFSEAVRRSEPPPGGNADGKPPGGNAAGKPKWPEFLTSVGAINGLTYLWEAVVSGYPAYFALQSNYYTRPWSVEHRDVPSVGFSGARQYNAHGEVVALGGRRYLLSMMLGVTAGAGNSLNEVLDYLKRSAAADGTHPTGTIYFVRNTDIRSRVRDELFPPAVAALRKLGVAAEILGGTVPLNKDNVQGVEMGTAAFDWKASGNVILPGAICDNFTSFGGVMKGGTGQTPLSEFLRYGAAGASGTVTEPMSIADKFPSPLLQVHYARGCTLAEAFYQSVHGPYQLLIVGDPLCCPWADAPQVSVAGVEAGAVVHGVLSLQPAATVTGGQSVEMFELFVDGQHVAECKPGGTLTLDTTKVGDGYHQLRVVAIGPGPIESQGRQIIPVRLDNYGRKIEVSAAIRGVLRRNASLRITAQSPGSVGIVAIQGSRIVGHITGEGGQMEIAAGTLGAGPVQLRVAGLGEGGTQTNVMAQPLDFVVE